MSSCQNLTKVTVAFCDRLKYLFSYSMVNSLVQLQHLEICYCWSMEGVVETNSTESRRDEGRLIEIVFPKLLYLRLIDLPKLMGFSMGIHSVEFPSLLELQIDDCPNMKRFISISSSQDNIHTNPQPLFDEKVSHFFFFQKIACLAKLNTFFLFLCVFLSLNLIKISLIECC